VTVEALRSVAGLLAVDPLSADNVAEELGSEESRSAGDIHVAPFHAAFAEATVVREAGGEAPAHATLALAEPTSVDELAEAFGRPSLVGAEEKVPAQAVFALPVGEEPYRVTLIANVGAGGLVRRVTLRRDPRG
jgi:hypothetical protein